MCSAVTLLIAGNVISASPSAVGFLEGQLKISSPKEVDLAEETASQATGENVADYPLIVMSPDGKRQIARVTAGKDGKYRVALPPGDYILDVLGRRPKGHLRATPQPFRVVSNQTVHVDMNIDTGVR
jgi:hypothetical protein